MLRNLFAAALLCFASTVAFSAPFPTLSMDVGVCDPNAPQNCVKPDTNGAVPVTGSITANLGGFHQESVLTPITATTGGVSSSAFTAGKTVVVTNAGTTNVAYCQFGAAATTSSQPIAPNGGWFAFTSVAETLVTCATSTSTTTVNFAVGTGLPTGTGGGGGSGGGGGGAVTLASGAVASGAYASGSIASGAYASGSIGSGAMVDLGAIADAAATAGSTGSLSAKMRLLTSQLDTLNTTAGNPLAAQSVDRWIGNTGVTDGTTVASIKAASTPAVAGDKALVVDQRPGTANGSAGQGATGATAPTGATQMGVRAQDAEAAAATNGQLKAPAADLTGKQIMLPYANPENSLNGQITTAMTGTTSTALTGMGAQGAGVRVYVTNCTITNEHATVGTRVLLQDGSGGATLWQFPASINFGGSGASFNVAGVKTTANTGLFAVNATTGASTFVSCTGYKGI